MGKVKTQGAGYRFGDIYLDATNRQLWRSGRLVPLSSKYFDVLLLLVSQSGRLVEKERIFEEVWDGLTVTDSALTQCIKDIRRQLGDDAGNPRYIKTIPKHGYIFIGDTLESSADGMAAAPALTQALRSPRPYKFLDYYTEQDAPLFFGREMEVEAICSQVLAHRSFILHGRSGVGKSSILRAGLIPRLRSEGHVVFVVRSFTDPIHQMVIALSEASEMNVPAGAEPGLEEILRRVGEAYPSRYAIFFLDQFEEFFSLLSEGSRSKFTDAICKSFADEDLPLRLVFALREDLLAEMSHLKPAVPEIFHHEYRLRRLSREQAARAISGPAEAVGCQYERELIDRLLDDLSDGGGVDPPQLQIVCDSLYDSRSPAGRLTVSAYEHLGTASRILTSYLERVLSRFGAADLRTAKEVLKALISADGGRLVLRASELNARVGGEAYGRPTPVGQLVEEMVAARVVRRRSQDGEGWVELAHDFLIPEISRWLTAEESALKQARGVIERAMENYHAHRLTIDSEAIDILLPFGERLGLTGREADLLVISLLNRARPVPDWLVRTAPSAPGLISDAFRHPDPDVRLCAVGSCRPLSDQEAKYLLRSAALWERALKVRKAASIALADRFGEASREIFSENLEGKRVGLIRLALSLAVIRDHDKSLVRLSGFSIPVALLVVIALVWVRLKRGWPEALRRGMGGTLGGASSGFVGGLLLGVVLTMARRAAAFEAASLVVVLIILGITIGTIGGFGVSFGMAGAAQIAYRHSRWWTVAGSALGGAAVGGITKLLGIYTLRALIRQIPTEIAGAF